MSSKINKSRERERTELHSPQGVAELRKAVKFGLRKKYIGIAESMWTYEGMDNPLFEDMQVMSQDTVPEVFLMKNGQCVWFKDDTTGQIHCLPLVMKGGVNMYGKMNTWCPVPVGYADKKNMTAAMGDPVFARFSAMNLTYDDSVVMKNDLFGGNDEEYVNAMIDELVDNTLTMNQLQLIAKCPFVFNVTSDNLLTAKNFFLAMSEDKPVIFTNALGDKALPTLEPTDHTIDPALFELFDRFECQILEYLGFPCVPITKRAQQSVSEVQSNDMKIYMRRQEKWNQREKACERINEMWGTDLHCISVIDDSMQVDANGTEDEDEPDEDSDADAE